ncbi:MaoC family dehydratase [Cupriavidus sp. Marseille-Q8015]|nr:MAG: acyl dehydratase [Cupriavidus sp.]
MTQNIETVGIGFHWNDLPVGRTFKTVGRTVFEADIVNFIGCTGQQEVLFNNLEFLARESAIQGRVAPGALVFAFAEGLLVQSTMQGTGFAFLNMELNIKGPVLVGDTIHVECEVLECRASNSRPGFGIVRTRNHIVNQRGEIVQTYTPLRLVKGRHGAQ